MWKILKSGGAGSAETIYPHFLPLLSKLNRDIFGEKVLTFYGNFFEHMNTGLRARLIYQANSRSDIAAISNAYYECLQYILIQIQTIPCEAHVSVGDGNGNGSDGDGSSNSFNAEQYALNLLQTHIIDVISYLLLNANLSNGKHVLIRMVELIQFWNQTRANNSIYNALLTRFWNELYTTIEKSFGNTEADQQLRSKLELIHDLVQSLRSRPINVTKVKSAKVKFNIDIDAAAIGHDTNDPIGSNSKTIDTDKPTIYFKDEINELIVKLCKFYIKKTSDSVTDHFVRPLEHLLNEFGNSTKFFEQLCGSATDIAKLYDKFASWLLLKEIRSESVLDIVLMLYHHLDPIEKSKLLNKLVKFPNECVKNWTLSRLLSHPLCTEPEVGRLLSQPIVTAQILKNAEEMAAGKTNETVNLMHKCFFQTESGDILIDNKTCESIIEILCNALTAAATNTTTADVDDTVLDTCVSFLAQIMPVICGDEQKGRIRDRMFVKLFGLCIDKERLAMLSEDTLWEAITSWQDALSSNDIQLTPALLETCAELIENSMNAIIADSNVTVQHIESVAEITSKLIVCSIERFEDDDELKYQNADQILASIFTKLEKQYTEYFNGCLQACTFIELLNGGITAVPTILQHLENDLGAIDVYRNANALLKLATFKFRAVFNLTCTVPKSRKSSESESETENGNGNGNDDSNHHDPTDEKPTALEEEHTEDFCDMNESLLKKWSEKIYDEIYGAIYLGGLFNSFLDNFNVMNNSICKELFVLIVYLFSHLIICSCCRLLKNSFFISKNRFDCFSRI